MRSAERTTERKKRELDQRSHLGNGPDCSAAAKEEDEDKKGVRPSVNRVSLHSLYFFLSFRSLKSLLLFDCRLKSERTRTDADADGG